MGNDKKAELCALLEQFKAGDEDAFTEIYRRCQGHITFLCTQLCDSKEDAEEVVQDTFMDLYRQAPTITGDTLMGLLRKIAARKCYHKTKTVLAEAEHMTDWDDNIDIADPSQDYRPEAQLNHKESTAELIQVINNLPKAQRKMIYLYYYADISTEEIAKMQNCSAGYVRKALHIARNAINKKMSGAVSGLFIATTLVAEEAAFAANFTGIAAWSATNAGAITTAGTGVTGSITAAKIAAFAACAVAAVSAGAALYFAGLPRAAAPDTPTVVYETVYETVYEPPPVTAHTPPITSSRPDPPTPPLDNEPTPAAALPNDEPTPNPTLPHPPDKPTSPDVAAQATPIANSQPDIPTPPPYDDPTPTPTSPDDEPTPTPTLPEPPDQPTPPETVVQDTPIVSSPLYLPLPPPLSEPPLNEPTPEPARPDPPTPANDKPTPAPPPEPARTDRTAQILTALAAASNAETVRNIIDSYGFALAAQFQSATDRHYRFYVLDDGSGDILVGVGAYQDGNDWRMQFEHYAGGQSPQDRFDLLRWMRE